MKQPATARALRMLLLLLKRRLRKSLAAEKAIINLPSLRPQ